MNQTTTRPTQNMNYDPFAGPAIARVVHTTQAQLEIWTSCQLGGENANRAYNESISLQLEGKMNPAAMGKAFQSLVERHDSLRAVFSTDGRFMSIFEALNIELHQKDFLRLTGAKKQGAVARYLRNDANHIFDLVNGPLLKAGLLRVSETDHRLVVTAHHIICDGWSLGILLQEIGALYSAFVAGQTPVLPQPESFIAYADGQQALMERGEYRATEQFWIQKFEPPIAELSLPTDFPRPPLRTYGSDRLDFPLDNIVLADLKKMGIQSGCSLVTTLLAAFEIFLYRLTGQDDIVVGLPTAGQSVTGMHQLIGHCVNLLPLRSKIPANVSFTTYLKQRKSDLFDAYDHQQLSFGQLLQKLFVARDASRVPLVPVVFNIDLGLMDGVSFTDLSYSLINNPRHYETFEIFLNASGTEENLVFEWSYNTALFRPETIRGMMASFEEVLQRLTANPTATVAYVARIDLSAYEALNATEAEYPDIPLHELLAKRALAFPHRKAVKFAATAIAYSVIHQQANQLAHYLYGQGVQKGDFVGVALPRSEKLPVALLAIMQCGAAYLPLDPEYPVNRLEFMLKDSGATFLLTTEAMISSLKVESATLPSDCTSLPIDAMFRDLRQYPIKPLSVKVDPDDVAYLLYTSGSTGRPKGVPISHKNLVNLLCSISEKPGIDENDRLLAITTISFDIAAVELFLPFMKGACCVIADSETARDGRLLLEILQTENISILQATPSTWQMLLDAPWSTPLPLKAFCGGEALSIHLARQLLSRCASLWNMYGPTETTIYSIIQQISMKDDPICIGRPIGNTQVYLLNEHGQPVPPGAPGEIAIGGDGVANGYWKRSELIAEKFIENPFDTKRRSLLYRTGDLGILLVSGEIQCLGRTDQQVKIRGHRIEPGEVEQVLTGLNGIRTAVVLAQNDRLIAHIVPSDLTGTGSDAYVCELKSAIQAVLPTFLVPQEIKIWEALPTTPNGKLDRRKLLEYQETYKHGRAVHTGPQTDTEKLLAKLWQECLNLEKIDIHTDFFELGGHSLLAARVMAKIEQETGKRLPLSVLLEHPTVKKLSRLLDAYNDSIAFDTLVPIRPNGDKDPIYIIHGVGLTALKFKDIVKHLDKNQPVYGLQGLGYSDIDGVPENVSVEQIAKNYITDIITANPNGPYVLAGHSYGGIIAYEMARQLTNQGKTIKSLIILDAYVEPYFYFERPLFKKISMIGYHTGRLLDLSREMGSSWNNFKFHIARKKEYLSQKYSGGGKEKSDRQQELQEIEEIDVMNENIMRSYHLVPENFKIDLFRAEKNTYYMHDPITLGWKDIALKGISIHNVPGNHLDMFSPPNDKVTARILQRVLDKAVREDC